MSIKKVRNSDGQIWEKDGVPLLSFPNHPAQSARSLAWQTKLKNEVIVAAADNCYGPGKGAEFLALVLELRADLIGNFTR